MHKPLSLRQNFSWAFVGSIIASGCQWATLIVIAKLLSATEVGYYALGLAITAPVIIFSRLQLRAIQVTDARSLNKYEDFFAVRLLTNCVAILVILGILVSLAGRYDFRVYAIIFVIGLNKIIESTSDIAYGLLQKHERLDRVAQSLILRNIGAVVLMGIAIKLTGSLVFGTILIGSWWLFVLFVFDKRSVEKFGRFVPRFHGRIMLSIIWLGLPLGIVMGIISFNSSVPRYFIEAYLGSKNLGYFAAMAYVVVAASRMILALGQSASARLARYYISNQKAYVKLLSKMLSIALVLAIGSILFGIYLGKPFLSIVYKPEYAERKDVFVWLMVSSGVIMLVQILGFGMTATRRFKSQIPVFGVSCGICALSSWLLVPRYEMKGAAWAILLSAIAQLLGTLVVILHSLTLPLRQDVQKEVSYE